MSDIDEVNIEEMISGWQSCLLLRMGGKKTTSQTTATKEVKKKQCLNLKKNSEKALIFITE